MVGVDGLREHLLGARLAGVVATSREASLRRYRAFAARDPRVLMGVDPQGDWGVSDLVALMAEKCGVSADPGCTSGHDVIDPERTLRALDAFAERVGAAARRRAPVLIGTGHPHDYPRSLLITRCLGAMGPHDLRGASLPARALRS